MEDNLSCGSSRGW